MDRPTRDPTGAAAKAKLPGNSRDHRMCAGIQRTKIFYCDPRRSEQKGRIEKSHEYIRYVLPKGTSFDPLSQEKVSLMMSHINSTARPSLQGKCPLDLAEQDLGTDVLERLGLAHIPPDEVLLTPKLLK